MKKAALLISLTSILLFSACKQFEKVGYGKYQTLPFGTVKPTGWIANQIKRDLDTGLTGHFDEFAKTVTYDLFVKQNRISGKYYDGLKCWWSGEHEGYWKDGVLRSAFLINHPVFKERSTKWVNDIISGIDETGYIGIYDKKNRYHHPGENGELWVTSRIMMPMIAYYEYTGDTKVLQAIEKSVQQTMLAYADSTAWVKGEGGVSHGIGYFEVLEWLYRTTQKQEYATFSKHLYDDFCKRQIRDDDLKKQYLLDTKRLFIKHGAHIAEGFLVPQYIADITQDDTMHLAAKQAFEKLNYHTTPSGAMVCAENVSKKKGSADEYYEYCTTTEFLNPLGIILSNTGNFSIADRMEKMVFNALQGGRLPDLKALSYITADNRLHMDPAKNGARQTYDADHKAASCCALNGSRVMPYYVQHMWKKDDATQTLLAMMYGPCEVKTKIAGANLTIVEKTNYPFSDEITFDLKLDKAATFDLVLRKPHNAASFTINGIDKKHIRELEDRLILSRKWDLTNSFTMVFNFEIEKKKDNDMVYLQRGPLVYALPFDYTADTLRTHGNTDFHQFVLHVTDSTRSDYKILSESTFEFAKTGNTNFNFPFDAPVVSIEGAMVTKEGEKKKVVLVPLGNTVMRKTSFKQKAE